MDLWSLISSLDFTRPLVGQLHANQIWAYAILAVTTAPPLVPNSALLVTGGLLAARGELNIVAVLLVVAVSALLGDAVIHRGGRAMRGAVVRRLYRRPRRGAALEWATGQIQRHGVPFVIGFRFLPSGRLWGGLAAGVVRYPARKYLLGAVIAEGVWATYSVGLGYFGGRATSNTLYAVAVGIAVSLLVAGIGTFVQVVLQRRARRQPPPSKPDPPPGMATLGARQVVLSAQVAQVSPGRCRPVPRRQAALDRRTAHASSRLWWRRAPVPHGRQASQARS